MLEFQERVLPRILELIVSIEPTVPLQNSEKGVLRIFLAEHELDSVFAISRVFSEVENCQLKISSSGQDALRSESDILILAEGLPDVSDSLELISAIRQQNAGLFIIVLLPSQEPMPGRTLFKSRRK